MFRRSLGGLVRLRRNPPVSSFGDQAASALAGQSPRQWHLRARPEAGPSIRRQRDVEAARRLLELLPGVLFDGNAVPQPLPAGAPSNSPGTQDLRRAGTRRGRFHMGNLPLDHV